MNISPKKQKAITALLEQPTIQKAAEQAGCGVTTLHRWLNDKDFMAAFKAAKKEIVTQTISRIQGASGKAVDALVEILTDGDCPPSTRVSAARTILEMTHKSIEIEDLQERLDAIEDILKREGKCK